MLDASISAAGERGLVFLDAEDDCLDGRCVTVDGHARINFASCSYLGLELDPRLREGVIDAVERYGTQFSSSRIYVSAPLYSELEALLDRITGGHSLVTPNVMLGHLSALPVLIGEEDAAILDHQVHHTVKLALPQLREQGSHVEFVRHGRLDQLEERIRALQDRHRRVWYLADGVYSMFGDFAPVKALNWLLTRYESLHLYVDDAHGMSWCGAHGRGFALENLTVRDKVVVALSLNKAFGAAGGAVVLPTSEMLRRVRTCGGPMIFNGPVQPPMLGAALASARIHLSDEIVGLQQELEERIHFANRLAIELDLPLVSQSVVPIRFLGLGTPKAAHDMTAHLLERGLLTNIATFPAVSARNAGVRFTITRHQSLDDVRRLLHTAADYLPTVLESAGITRADVDRSFGLDARARHATRREMRGELICQHATSIRDLDPDEWDACLGERGSFGWSGLAYLEQVFAEHQEPENRWGFHYYVVRDGSGRPVLATFFTDALWKDDMVTKAEVSRVVEVKREQEPYFLTSRVLAMGSLLTEGDHLYLDRSADWRGALALLLTAIDAQQEECDADLVALRDLDGRDAELAACLREEGYTPIDLPRSSMIEIDWSDWDEHVARLGPKARRFQRRHVQPLEGAYAIEVFDRVHPDVSDRVLAHLYRLYTNVKERNLELNTFPLPEDFLRHMVQHPSWEIVTLTLRPECGGRRGSLPQAFVASYIGPEQYVPVVTGLDYPYVQSHGAYRQMLLQCVRRAEAHEAKRLLFGMGADMEKRRFGAVPVQRVMYVRSRDHYQQDVLSLISAESRPSGPGGGS